MTLEVSITAVVVDYHGGDELLDRLRSLLAQTVPDPEVIVVDTASTDGSIPVISLAGGIMKHKVFRIADMSDERYRKARGPLRRTG